MKDLEIMMQNMMDSAFETVKTVEGGVELLDIFCHLSPREVSKDFLCIVTRAEGDEELLLFLL